MRWEVIKPITDNPGVQLAALILGVASVVLAIYFYVKSKKDRLPSYTVLSTTLVEGLSSELQDLKVTYKGEACERVTVSKLWFWNAGKEPIRRTDFVGAAPLAVVVAAGVKVMSARVIFCTDEATKFADILTEERQGKETLVKFDFDYLDYNDGGIIEIVHTGNEETEIGITGKIIGSTKHNFVDAFYIRRSFIISHLSIFERILVYTIFFAPIVIPVASLVFGFDSPRIPVPWLMVGAAVGMMYPFIRQHYFGPRIPNTFPKSSNNLRRARHFVA
jgi:hypothetical protein